MAESKIPSLKNEIRSQIRMLRAELQKPEAIGRKETMDAQIREQVLALLSRLRAEKKIPDTVYLYASFGGGDMAAAFMTVSFRRSRSISGWRSAIRFRFFPGSLSRSMIRRWIM